MSKSTAQSVSEATLTAVITRADGTVEHVGMLGAQYRSRRRQLWWDLVGRRQTDRRIRQINRRHAARNPKETS